MLTPALAILAGNMLVRNDARGWPLIFAVPLLGFDFDLQTDAVLKPAIVLVIYGWLAWMMTTPARWRAVVEDNAAACAAPEWATTGVIADHR